MVFNGTYKDVLNLIISTFDVVQHHILGDVFPVLQLIHFVICVCVEDRPTQKLCQSLLEEQMHLEASMASTF